MSQFIHIKRGLKFLYLHPVIVTLALALSACGDLDRTGESASTEPDSATLYQQHCSDCHGARGEGGVGRALNGSHLEEMSEAQLFMMIYEGIGSSMPSFKSTLTSEQIAEMVTYIRAL